MRSLANSSFNCAVPPQKKQQQEQKETTTTNNNSLEQNITRSTTICTYSSIFSAFTRQILEPG